MSSKAIPVDDARTWASSEWMAPILSVVVDGGSDAVDYQLRLILDERFVRLPLVLDDVDGATPQNLAAPERDAVRLLRTHRSELDGVARLLDRPPRP